MSAVSSSTVSLSAVATAKAQQVGTSATTSATTTTTTSAQGQVSASANLGKLSSGLAKAHERVSAQLQSESASISQLGQYKATVSSLSGVASALAGVGAGTVVADVVKKAESFVATFNAAVQQAKGNSAVAGTVRSDASQAMAESRRALASADASRSQLGKLGFARQADGTLKLDATALKKALASDAAGTTGTLAQMGKAMAKRAEAELTGDSRIALAAQRANARALALKQQQGALVSTATQMAQSQTTGGSVSGSVSATTGTTTGTSARSWATLQALRRYADS